MKTEKELLEHHTIGMSNEQKRKYVKTYEFISDILKQQGKFFEEIIDNAYNYASDNNIGLIAIMGPILIDITSRMLGISHPAVSKWKVIPPFRAFQIAKLGDFSIEYIRPDLRITPER